MLKLIDIRAVEKGYFIRLSTETKINELNVLVSKKSMYVLSICEIGEGEDCPVIINYQIHLKELFLKESRICTTINFNRSTSNIYSFLESLDTLIFEHELEREDCYV